MAHLLESVHALETAWAPADPGRHMLLWNSLNRLNTNLAKNLNSNELASAILDEMASARAEVEFAFARLKEVRQYLDFEGMDCNIDLYNTTIINSNKKADTCSTRCRLTTTFSCNKIFGNKRLLLVNYWRSQLFINKESSHASWEE